jgi:hypothetical protein
MTEKTVTVRLPASIYERLTGVAEASGRPFDEVLLQTIRNGMPPSLQKVPTKYHRQLLDLNKLDDQALWGAIQKEQTPEESDVDAVQMDLFTLRRAYALALLKWRGHPIPDPTELLF